MVPIKSNIDRVRRAGDTYAINCYGAVLHALGRIPQPKWAAPWELDCFVLQGCQPLYPAKPNDRQPADLKPGDVLVMQAAEYPSTNHAALYVGPGDRWFHKCGHTPAEFTTLDGVLDSYDFVAITYARPKTDKTLAELIQEAA